MLSPALKLKGFSFKELSSPEGLLRLDAEFQSFLQNQDPTLALGLKVYRQANGSMSSAQKTEWILEAAPFLESFIAEIFMIEPEVEAAQELLLKQNPIFAFKKQYVLRLAKHAGYEVLPDFQSLNQWLMAQVPKSNELELSVAELGVAFLESQNQESIDRLTQWVIAVSNTPEGQALVKDWVSFHQPKRLDYQHLVKLEPVENLEGPLRLQSSPSEFRSRDGFDLTDNRMNQKEILNEIHYCVYCHKNEGDFCSSGFPVKKSDLSQGIKTNPLGETLNGCPLDEKISEMHTLKRDGWGVAALATIMIDNPMCPATGHRICNDCMKSCIYQKQEPVNIPQVETGVLTDILALPWGVEIYLLLTRWNPLRERQWILKPYNGLKVLVMGMGPAGFSLAHHLIMEGFAVVGADGLKIEHLPQEYLDQPIYRYQDLEERLSERVMSGFGGVAEYGITVRWDKNFLKLIYLSLVRSHKFQVVGSVRFGGTLTVEDAWKYGFDHLAVAVGAGLPRELKIENSLAPGMRQANDFLMALQLTGAAKSSSLANLQVRLPAVVIGGGLTGIDTATEVQAYYIVQVEKILKRYQKLVEQKTEAEIRSQFTPHDLSILDEFIAHGKAVQQERGLARAENRLPQFIPLLRQWGGVTVAYRRRMQDSPAYRRNHEEVAKALEEGIYYAEGLEPTKVKCDSYGDVLALEFESHLNPEPQILPARSIFVATGAKPNIAYEFEHRGSFPREGLEYQSFEEVDGILHRIEQRQYTKSEKIGAFTGYHQHDHRVSFLGDTHPVFHGSVVKAIASGKTLYPQIVNSLKARYHHAANEAEYSEFRLKIQTLFSCEVLSVQRHTSQVIELKVHAPIAARHFKPGQFYRLQNYERNAVSIGDTRLQTEAMALMAAPIPNHPDQLSFMILERGLSSRIAAQFKVGESLALMGPTGVRTKVAEGEIVLVIGSAMAAIYMRSMAQEWKSLNARVIFLADFKHPDEILCQAELEDICEQIIWSSSTPGSIKSRAQDQVIDVDWGEALLHYAEGHWTNSLPFKEIHSVWIIGPAGLLRAVQELRVGRLAAYVSQEMKFIASVYGPMQCMLKGVCAQCLQWQIDPVTGERTKAVYACSWHNQPLEVIDTENIDQRLGQNHMQERLGGLWLDYLEHL